VGPEARKEARKPETAEDLAAEDAPYWLWLNRVLVDGKLFDLSGRRYQQDIMRPHTPDGRFKHNEVIRKGAQIGITMGKVGEIVHGCIFGMYPQGVIVYFPHKGAVDLFSVSRFKPFITDNPETVGKYVTGTDRGDFRNIGSSRVYFLGCSATTRVGEGGKKDSDSVRSHSADWVLLDERDMFDEDMTNQVNQRLFNSACPRRTDMGTPTIPDFGVDLLYRRSDQRRWQIKCDSCHKYTCLETEFPDCIVLSDEPYFKCSHCGSHINSNNGSWEPDYPKRDLVGYWPSRLLNPNTNLTLLMKTFEDPEAYSTTKGEFLRTTIGIPHIDVKDELTVSDVLACQGRDGMASNSKIPCAMGVDVGNPLYAVIGHRLDRGRYKIIKVARVPDWGALHDLAKKFNIKSDVLDAQPEYHAAREFQRKENHRVYLCYYSETQRQFAVWTTDNIVNVLRTEVFDASHEMVKQEGVLTIPRVNEEVKLFANQLTKTVRVIETDGRTGQKIYRYRRRGDKEDHYRNALNYFYLACQKIGISQESTQRKRPQTQDMSFSLGNYRKGA